MLVVAVGLRARLLTGTQRVARPRRSCGTPVGLTALRSRYWVTNCADGVDNDGNGQIDCTDDGCINVTCGTGCVCLRVVEVSVLGEGSPAR